MRKNATHLAVAAAVALGLAACGGGGGSDPVTTDPDPAAPGEPGGPTNPDPEAPGGPGTPPDPDVPTKAITGAVGPTAEGGIVCLDSNRNLACDTDEWSTIIGTGGGYTLNVPEDTVMAGSIIVGQFAADSQYAASTHNDMVPRAPFTLATPGSDTSQMGALSTLVAVRMQADPALTPEQAMQQVRTELGLPADPSGDDPAELARIEAAALPALRQAANAKYLADESTDVGAATIAAAPSLVKVLQKYIEPGKLALWALVGEKTLVSEAVSDAAPQGCEIHPVETLRITTPGNAPITSKEEYVEDATVTFDPSERYPAGLSIEEAEIRGRGNTTWFHPQYLKKAYRIKLKKPGNELLGMPEARNWALLANYSDKSGLRNAVAFCLGKQMNLRYAQPSRFVEFYLNGDYQGVYQLTPHTEAHENRVNIGPVWPEEDEFNPEAGYLVEMDMRVLPPDNLPEDDPWFESAGPVHRTYEPHFQGRGYVIKSDVVSGDLPPAETESIKQQAIDSVKSDIDAMEHAFADPDPVSAASPLVDLEELVDFYLIQEFMRNSDAAYSSLYLHRPSGGKITFGPLWDFDLSSGNDHGEGLEGNNSNNGNWCPQGWWVRRALPDYFERLLQDPEFTRLLDARWQYLHSRLGHLFSYIDDARDNMAAAQARNFGVWNINAVVPPNWYVAGSYDGEVAYLKQWLQARADWINGPPPPEEQGVSNDFPGCVEWRTQWRPEWTPTP